MSHTSPATFLVWSIISCILFTFLVFHLWSFDRFRCLKWNSGPQTGAFKRVMTYSYLLSIPLVMTYSIGFAIIKYKHGFIVHDGAIIPMPYRLWTESERRALFPLMLAFAIGWSMEMITHLEELCFWLFLVNSGSVQQDWFKSWYFRTWIVGSCIAVTYMPLLTILTRSDPLKCEAYIFLGGSLGSLSLTLWFTPVLWAFPAFLSSLKSEGVDVNTIVRLTKFHELNLIRVVFRFVFVIPLVILGADGVKTHTHINESMLWTDFLAVISAFGLALSSALTLVIFFPRSVEGEIAARDAARERRRNRSYGHPTITSTINLGDQRASQYSYDSRFDAAPSMLYRQLSPQKSHASLQEVPALASPSSIYKEFEMEEPALRPNRRRGDDVELGYVASSQHSLHRNGSRFNPLVHNFTSPIDVYSGEKSRLTFTQR
ncbi:unnamed protein product [Mycena citricolor]|uniref:Uncharacterized protein n=1 Tax=Mycena citricolor TaxID=2018698 RepID=A0AAD2HVC5_9AGAR|nr:unnamed protein product [Mycena citricolor]